MDKKLAYALIDTYTLNDCLALLAVCAPDKLLALKREVRQCTTESEVLQKARAAVREAYAQERRAN